jgi:predicted DNA-binding transcriptional regulator AlpA
MSSPERTLTTQSENAHRPMSQSQPDHAQAKFLPASERDPLLTVDEVAARLNVSKDWVWDHSSRKAPHLPVIRLGDGTLRYRASRIEDFINERERLTELRKKRVK